MESSVSENPRPGSVLQGRYRIQERLGTGGMGVVYKAERLKLGRRVAIKFLHTAFVNDKKLLNRFEREAKAMSKLAHPHCVSVIDFGVDEAPYIVMDYVTGKTLRDLMDEGMVEPARAAHIGRQLLAGLAHAHGHGIIHRDIKPANIMLSEATGTGDHVRILDFGLAKLRDATSVGGQSMASMVVGTPNYMSPEQTRGDKVDARSDIYSTGVVLFELFTGSKPFTANEAFEVLRKHRDEAPPSLGSATSQEVFSPELEAVIAKALAKDPSKRFQTAVKFAIALDDVPEATIRHRTSTSGGQSPELSMAKTIALNADEISEMRAQAGPMRKRRRAPLKLAFFLVATAALAGWYYLVREGEPPAATNGAGDSTATTAGADTEAEAPLPDETEDNGEALVEEPEFDLEEVTAPDEAIVGEASDDQDPEVDEAAIAAALAEASAASKDETDDTNDGTADDGPSLFDMAEAAVEKTIPAADETKPPRPIKTINDIERAIRQGRREPAITALRRLRRRHPKSPYIPYLLGNLYFEKMWWSAGLGMYRESIRKKPSYRRNATVIRNAIRALGGKSTFGKARAFIVGAVGKPALVHLRRAARNNKSGLVRKRAKQLAQRIARRRW